MNRSLVAVAGPEGALVSPVVQRVLHQHPRWAKAVPCTTRSKNALERNGHHYWFLSKTEFESREKNGLFAETDRIHGQAYGVLEAHLEELLNRFEAVFLISSPQNLKHLIAKYGGDVLGIYIMPPHGQEAAAPPEGCRCICNSSIYDSVLRVEELVTQFIERKQENTCAF